MERAASLHEAALFCWISDLLTRHNAQEPRGR